MRIRKFNENIKNDIDPYGEENWNEEDDSDSLDDDQLDFLEDDVDIEYDDDIEDDNNYNDAEAIHSLDSGTCINCGAHNLDYYDNVNDGDHLYMRYECTRCHTRGEEVYTVDFVENRRSRN